MGGSILLFVSLASAVCIAFGLSPLLLVTPALIGLRSFFFSSSNHKTLVPGYLSNPINKVVYSTSLFVSCSCYVYYTVLLFGEEGIGIPPYQRIGLCVAWIGSIAESAVAELKPKDGILAGSSACVAAGGWVLASGFATTVTESDFETATAWLWVPALHYVVFHAGVYCALKTI